jgi:hypothetical protein
MSKKKTHQKPIASVEDLRNQWLLNGGSVSRTDGVTSVYGPARAWLAVYRMGRSYEGKDEIDPTYATLLQVAGDYRSDLTSALLRVYDFGRGFTREAQKRPTFSGPVMIGVDTGRKHDSGKPDLTQLRNLPNALAALCRVLDHGANKYGRNNYKLVPSERYDKALLRHALSEGVDSDSGELHAAHVAACALIYLENLATGKAETPKAPPIEGLKGLWIREEK